MMATMAPRAVSEMDASRARGWVTAAVIATVAGFALGLGYVVNEGIFAPLSDLAAVAFAVTLLPVALYFHRVFTPVESRISTAAVIVAVAGLSLLAVSGAALTALNVTTATTSLPVLEAQHLGIFMQGVWMVAVGALGLRRAAFRARTSWGAVVGGAGYSLGAPVSLWLGFETSLFYLAFLVALAGFLTWALSLRSELGEDRGVSWSREMAARGRVWHPLAPRRGEWM